MIIIKSFCSSFICCKRENEKKLECDLRQLDSRESLVSNQPSPYTSLKSQKNQSTPKSSTNTTLNRRQLPVIEINLQSEGTPGKERNNTLTFQKPKESDRHLTEQKLAEQTANNTTTGSRSQSNTNNNIKTKYVPGENKATLETMFKKVFLSDNKYISPQENFRKKRAETFQASIKQFVLKEKKFHPQHKINLHK